MEKVAEKQAANDEGSIQRVPGKEDDKLAERDSSHGEERERGPNE